MCLNVVHVSVSKLPTKSQVYIKTHKNTLYWKRAIFFSSTLLRSLANMPYLYGITDIKYSFKEDTERSSPVPIKFRYNTLLTRRVQFSREEWPLPFRATPASLVELCVNVVDKLPLPSVFEWTDVDIRLWITRYGYPQYMVSLLQYMRNLQLRTREIHRTHFV